MPHPLRCRAASAGVPGGIRRAFAASPCARAAVRSRAKTLISSNRRLSSPRFRDAAPSEHSLAARDSRVRSFRQPITPAATLLQPNSSAANHGARRSRRAPRVHLDHALRAIAFTLAGDPCAWSPEWRRVGSVFPRRRPPASPLSGLYQPCRAVRAQQDRLRLRRLSILCDSCKGHTARLRHAN